jgi:hypothetical protein
MAKYQTANHERHRSNTKYLKAKLRSPKYLKYREFKSKRKKHTYAYLKANLTVMKMLSQDKVNLNKLTKALNICNQLGPLSKDFDRYL